MLEDIWFTREIERAYNPVLIERIQKHFGGSVALTEAFCALHGQFDMLIDEFDVFLGDGEKQTQEDWRPEGVLEAVDEAAKLARDQNSPVWPHLAAIATSMRAMFRVVPIMPSTEFKQDEAEGVPPGLFALLQKKDARPVDLVVAAVSDDFSSDALVGSAVLAERARCESVVKDRIKDLFGDDKLEDLDSEEGWVYEQLERARSEIARDQEEAAQEDFGGDLVEQRTELAEEAADSGEIDPPSSGAPEVGV